VPDAPQALLGGLTFTECPRWRDGELFFSDMHAGQVLAVTPAGECRVVAEVPGTPGGLGWLPDGTLLVTSQNQRQVLRVDPDGLGVHADLTELGDSPLNDMWVDAEGYAYVGEMGFDVHGFLHPAEGQEPVEIKHGRVICLDPAGAVVSTVDELLFPNGIVRRPDGRLVVAESFGFTVSDLEGDPVDGFTKVKSWQLSFAPDGIAIDAEGRIWVADPAGGRAVRLGPEGEEAVVLTCDQQCLAVAVGPGQTLYLCTSPTTIREEAQELRGSRIDVAQAPA
jgi:sugar lactone lactonase YvrE